MSDKKMLTRTLAQAALMAALSYIGFQFFRIDIPVGDGRTAIHMGNAFVVLGGLLLGGLWGGLAGAVGLSLADLTAGYVTSAPKTFVLKLLIGLIAGLLFRKAFKVTADTPMKKTVSAAILSAAAALIFNVAADPIVGYFYKTYILGIPQNLAETLAKIGAVTTLVNAAISIAAASIFFLAIYPALRKAGLLTDGKK